MKKLLFALLFTTSIITAQDERKVWDLLLTNKREEARALFDKTLKKGMDGSIELLILDAMIDQERGKLLYDITFLEKLAKLEESENYIYPLWYTPFLVGDVKTEGFDDLSYQKMDLIAGTPQYKDDPFVIYFKGIFDRKRLNEAAFDAGMDKLGVIPKWQFCGVFENMNGSGIYTDYEPEYYANNDKVFNANSNGLVSWYIPAIDQHEGCHFYINESEYGYGVMYSQVFIDSDADREVILDFGASGPLKIFLNDVEIYANDKIKLSNLNAYHLKFNLSKGTNRLLLKSATAGGGDYFYAALKDTNRKEIPSLVYNNTYRPYNKSTLAQINPVEVTPYYEEFLLQKIKANPDNILYKILLFDTYANNRKNVQAYDVIEELAVKYPNSSLLNVRQLVYYTSIEDEQKTQEITKNLLLNDEDYYYSIISKFDDNDWLAHANIAELERYRDKARKLQSDLYALLYDYMILMRNSDIDMSIEKMEEIMAKSYNNELYTTLFAPLYTSFKNDKAKTISILEEMVSKKENVQAQNILMGHYNSMGRKEDAKKIIDQRVERYPYFNYVYDAAISFAANESDYETCIRYADAGLKNFPYSYRLMEEKGRGYNSLKNTTEAEKLFRQSLIYNSGNTSLRKTLYDITKVPDEIEQVAKKDIYTLIKQRRNSKMACDYGVNLLLDEYIVNILPEGGRKAKTTVVLEVIAENGIEEIKEYQLGGSNINIIKAEIVKPDGSVAPGETNYDTVVFTNLQVKDVVYIEYETLENNYGRFFKDFDLNYYFNGSYPSRQNVFGIIYPSDVKFDHQVLNGSIPSKTRKINGKTYISWETSQVPAIPLYEDYSPHYSDLCTQVRVSSIKSWSEISNWYADLVKKNMQMDNAALKAYNEIFPKGVEGLSEEERAFRIYKYIGENITYSSLDFRQSGYVPQKPSKTVSTKLGDCKDVSTLFVAMAERAGLKSNLVLVLTSDNGIDALRLPAINFNHCIVRVMIDGNEHFLELTDNYLPFKALPVTLYKAKALVISFDKAENEKGNVINIPFDNALKNVVKSTTVVNIEENQKNFNFTAELSGLAKSYYNQLFSSATTEEMRKKELEEELNGRLNKTISLESGKLLENDRFSERIKYETKFSISEKVQSVGSLKIVEVPYVDKVYTRDIITNEKRNYDIDYSAYERMNAYDTEVILNIAEGKKFAEVPESREFVYRGHKYSISYELLSPNSLKVTRRVNTPWDNIKTADYPEFKKFVEEVLAAEEEIIGYK